MVFKKEEKRWEKGSHIASTRLQASYGADFKDSEKVGIYSSTQNLEKELRRQRKKLAHNLGILRLLRIHCCTFRHWKATREYAKTKDVLSVQKLLGHRNSKNILHYM